MNKYENSVPFDPGYSLYYVDFYSTISPFIEELSKVKIIQQKKYKLSIIQPEILTLVRKSTGFYLGCLLWAAYISNRFKSSPKEIADNISYNQEAKDEDLTNTIEYLNKKIEFIKKLEKDYLYFLKKPLNVDKKILNILETYTEFIKLNNNFVNTKLTSDVKLPDNLSYFSDFSETELDEMETKIQEVINSGKLEDLIDLGFYKS